MSDGYPCHDMPSVCEAFCAEQVEALSPHAPRAYPKRGGVPFDIDRLAEWLPRLGTVLWLERREALPPTRLHVHAGARPLRLEHVACRRLGRCAGLCAYSVVSPHGPREWLTAQVADGAIEAKMFLLPDSDCLAWDQMNRALGLEPGDAARNAAPTHATFLQRARARFGHRWQARLLAFERARMPWLDVLAARPPLRISLLGLDIARGIAHDENAEWAAPFHRD